MPRNMSHSLITLGLIASMSGCAAMQNPSTPQLFGRRYSPETRFKVARAQESGGKLHEAREIYMKLYRDGNRTTRVCHRLAIVSARMNDKAASERFFREAVAKDQRNPDILTDYGYAKSLQADLKGAEMLYRQALQIRPGHKRALNNLGIALAHQKRDSESLTTFRRAVGEAQAYSNLAYIQAQRGDGHLAAQNYSRALSIDPSLKPASNAMVQLASMEQRYLKSSRGRQFLARRNKQHSGGATGMVAMKSARKTKPKIKITPKSKAESLIAEITDKPAKGTGSGSPAKLQVKKPKPVRRTPIQIVETVPEIPKRSKTAITKLNPSKPSKSAVVRIGDADSTPSRIRLTDSSSQRPMTTPRRQSDAAPFPTTSRVEPIKESVAPAPMPQQQRRAVPRKPRPAASVVRIQDDRRFKPPVVKVRQPVRQMKRPIVQRHPLTEQRRPVNRIQQHPQQRPHPFVQSNRQPRPLPPKSQPQPEKEFVLNLDDDEPQTPANNGNNAKPNFVSQAAGSQYHQPNDVNHASGNRYRHPMAQPAQQQYQPRSTGRVRLSKPAQPRSTNGGHTGVFRLQPSN